MAKRGRKPSTPAQPSEARGVAAGVGRAQGKGSRGRTVTVTVWDDATNEAAVLAAMAHPAIQNRKAKQDAFERNVAFEYFSRMPREELTNQLKVGGALDWIARCRGTRRPSQFSKNPPPCRRAAQAVLPLRA
jgi:hypothetical protein